MKARWAPLLGLLALLPDASRAQHAAVVTEAEARLLERILAEVSTARHFCLPCGDSAWTPVKVSQVGTAPARPSSRDEWALFLNGKPVDAAYLYVPRNGRWVNAASAAGVKFPDIPHTLAAAMKAGEVFAGDSAFAFFTWAGAYGFVDSVRQAKSRHAASVVHSLKIFDLGDSLSARLEVNGVGVSHRMDLRALGSGDTVTFVLRRYLKENFGKPFPPGARLFSLIRRPGGVIATRWQALKPAHRPAAARGFALGAPDPFALEE